MRLHFNASRAHIGNRFPFLSVSLLIIDRNSPIPYPRRRRNTISMAFPRPGVAISSRAFSGVLDSDIQFPRFVDFVIEKEEKKRERVRKKKRVSSSYMTMQVAAASYASSRLVRQNLGKTSSDEYRAPEA